MLALGACSSAGDDASSDARATPSAEGGVGADVIGAGVDGAGQLSDLGTRRRLRTATVGLVAPDAAAVASVADEATSVAIGLGGLVDADQRTSGGRARAALVLRVPPDDLEEAVRRLRELAEVDASSIDTDDVTAEYADLEGRIATLEASVARLRALIAEADDVVQISTLEGELTNREAQLESATGQLRVLTAETDLATIDVTISTPEPAAVEDSPSPIDALAGGWAAFVASATWLLAALAAGLPFLVTVAALIGALRWVRRRSDATAAGALRHPTAEPAEDREVAAARGDGERT